MNARTGRSWVVVAVVAISMILAGPRTAAADEPADIVLAPGEQKTLPGDGVDSFSAASSAVIEVRVAAASGAKQLVIVGKTPGTTSLVLTLTNGSRLVYQVTVSKVIARHNVQLDVYFVQLSRSRATEIGLSWPTSVSASVAGEFTADTTGAGARLGSVSVSSTVLPRLDFAAENGWAKILDHTKIVMANGDVGTYSSGGDFNVQVGSGVATSVERISFGSTIKGRVVYDASTGRVEVQVNADMSRLAESRGSGVPGVLRTTVETNVNVALGESLALGGLFSTQERSSMRGFPLLSEIPVLGYLFGGRVSSREQIENVVFIVPSLVSPVSIADRDRVAEALKTFLAFDGGPIGSGMKALRTDPFVTPAERRP